MSRKTIFRPYNDDILYVETPQETTEILDVSGTIHAIFDSGFRVTAKLGSTWTLKYENLPGGCDIERTVREGKHKDDVLIVHGDIGELRDK